MPSGANKTKKVTFNFSAELDGSGPASASDYPQMILAWYKARGKDMIDLESLTLSYNPDTRLYQGTARVDAKSSQFIIETNIEVFVDIDDDGNYPILIPHGSPDMPNYISGNYYDMNQPSNYKDRDDIYLVSGKLRSIQFSNSTPTPKRRKAATRKNIMTKPCKRADQVRNPVTHRCRKVKK